MPDYSNRELDELFKAADQRADAFHERLMNRMDIFETNTTSSLQRIEKQTTATNGRVSKLENWRYFLTGGMSVIVIIVVPLLAWALWTLVGIKEDVHNAVDEALSAYTIEK